MRRPDPKSLLLGAALLAGAGGVAGVGVALTGAYDIAASDGHWPVVTAALAVARDRAIAVRAEGSASDLSRAPDLADAGLARLGARHYANACAACHGTPGGEITPTMAGMLPPPPDLAHASARYDAEELHFLVLHGLKFAGMPAWPTQARPDEPWALVAFVQALGRGEPYAALAGSDAEPGPRIPCARCHGGAGEAPADDLVPPLGGQAEAYLARALADYRDGARPSGIMAQAAHGLSDGEIAALAAEWAATDAPAAEAPPPEGDVGAGARLAAGEVEGVAACAACHEGPASDRYGRLDGLSAAYLAQQLALFVPKDADPAPRGRTPHGAIMAQAVRGLEPEMIPGLAAHLAAREGTE